MAELLLTPEAVRALIRECVTVIEPGETLIVRVPLDWDRSAVAEYQQRLTEALRYWGSPFRALVIPAEELAVTRHPAGRALRNV